METAAIFNQSLLLGRGSGMLLPLRVAQDQTLVSNLKLYGTLGWVSQSDRQRELVGSFKSAWRQHWQESEREPSTEKIRDSGNIVQVSLLFQMQDLDDQLTDHVDNCKQWTSKLNGQRGENERVEALSFLRPRKCWKHSTKCFYPFRILFSNDFRF